MAVLEEIYPATIQKNVGDSTLWVIKWVEGQWVVVGSLVGVPGAGDAGTFLSTDGSTIFWSEVSDGGTLSRVKDLELLVSNLKARVELLENMLGYSGDELEEIYDGD